MSLFHEINRQFPIRRTRVQKDAFLTWSVQQCAQLGYSAHTETLGKRNRSRNLIIGSPSEAEVVFTAHYDTPANMLLPNLVFPRNIVLSLLYIIGVVLSMLLVSVIPAYLVSLLPVRKAIVALVFLCTYCLLLVLMVAGPANRHNANDNTSGIALIFALMESLPENMRSKAAFILFDDNERNMAGSRAYAQAHVQASYTQLTINLDSVGLGNTSITTASPLARKSPFYPHFTHVLSNGGGYQVLHLGSRGRMLRSDDHAFKCSIGVMACKHKPIIGYYIPNLHTRHDVIVSEENIIFLAHRLAALWQEAA